MHASRQFGPSAPSLDAAERRTRRRSLRALGRVYAGPRAEAMNPLLRQADTDPAAPEPAADELDRLAPSTGAGSGAPSKILPVAKFALAFA